MLVVDDHPIVRRAIRAELESVFPSMEVGEAWDGASLMDRLLAEPWNAVVLDLRLPDRRGLDLLAEVRAHWPEIPVLALAETEQDPAWEVALHRGAAGCLAKTSPPGEYPEALRRALSARPPVRMGRDLEDLRGELNNVLTAILGYGQLVLRELGPEHAARGDVLEILRAGRRGAEKVRRTDG